MADVINFAAIPLEIRQTKRFCCWRAIQDEEGKIQKIPWDHSKNNRLGWSDDKTLISFREALDLYRSGQSYAGIGFILATESEFTCIDLDNCIQDGQISTTAKEIIEKFKSYTELSPSGKGLHIWVIAKISGTNTTQVVYKDQKIEMFVRSHHVTLTGRVLDGYNQIKNCQVEAQKLYDELKPQISTLENIEKTLSDLDKERLQHYVDVALQNAANEVRSQKEGTRDITLNACTYSLGRFVGAGLLSAKEVEKTLASAAIATGLKENQVKSVIRCALKAGKANPKVPRLSDISTKISEASKEIHEKAMDILTHGDPLQYVADSCGRSVLGAEVGVKKLCCCYEVQNIRQSEGLHPRLSGESGGGKTIILFVFVHHLPPETYIKGSMSGKAPFYHHDTARMFRLLDDYREDFSEDLDTVIKQTSSSFHEKYFHRTVVKYKPKILEIESEQTWALTSVDASQDIQILNRQLPINVDDSEELTVKVNNNTLKRYGEGKLKFPTDEAVLVCRELFHILRGEELINVLVPFYERIEWLDKTSRRNPSIFMDLVIAHTGIRRFQREKDENGFYLATVEDFEDAKRLFTDRDAEELVKKLTRKEKEVVQLLTDHPNGLTYEEIAGMLKPPVGTGRVIHIIKGKDGKSGLFQKLPIKETRRSDTTKNTDEDDNPSGYGSETTRIKTIHKSVFSLPNYNSLTGFDAVVRLRE